MLSGRSKKTTSNSVSTMTPEADLIRDTALIEATQDRFDHEAIAGVVADLTLNAAPPLNIALFGPWGSGKSSFFGLLRQRISESGKRVEVVRYDAWKYGGRALKKHFIGSVGRELGLNGDDLDESLAHDQEKLRLDLKAWLKDNKGSLALGLFVAIGVSVAWFALVSLAGWAVNRGGWHGLSTQMKAAVGTIGTALSLSFAALLVGPKILESAVVKVKDAAPETDDEFARSFQRLVEEQIDVPAGERLVVFIDELDRCSPKDVVATLIDLKTFLDVAGCIFIVAADREVLERALREVPQANPVRDEDPYYSTPGAFLDKIFQHQIPLPPLRPQALTRFARELVEQQGGLWFDLREAEADERLFLRVVYALVPVHVRSPRRVKVLLNNYATNVRIAQARGVDWIQRATEIACLTVLETEFPAVAADLVRIPRLLAYLRGEDCSSASQEVQRVVKGYSTLEDDAEAVPEDAQAAGGLLLDPAIDGPAKDRANKVLNAHLRSYLRKIAAQGIADPRPDLFYLQSAGHNDGLTDPDLGYAIDFAAELAASEVVEAFDEQLSGTLATGVRLLVQQAEAERGPGRSSIIEAACRLVERLDREDLEAVAPVAAGGVLAEVDSADWSREATPGALLLGVIGARSDLVGRLLAQDPANDLAKDGLLGRLSPVLTYANDEQAALVHKMLGNAYYRYPEPLHEALATLPLEAALHLWSATRSEIKDALGDLAPTPPVAAPASRTGVATPARAAISEAEDDKPEDTAAERYGALLTAVEARTDDAGALISQVLELGQRSGDEDIRDAVREREDDALVRIHDRGRINLHALIGIELAPIGDAGFWAGKLTDSATNNAQALKAFKRLMAAVEKADGNERNAISAAAPAVLSHVSDTQAEEARQAIRDAINRFDWTDEDERERRDVVYGIADAARALVGDEDIDDMLAMGIADGLSAGDSTAFIDEAIERIHRLSPDSASRLEEHLTSGSASPLPTLRLRIAAASRTGNPISSADVLAVKDEGDVDAAVVNEWLGLRPALAEALKVVASMTVSIAPLGRYASTLSIDDRTALWIFCEKKKFKPATLKSVGASGIGSLAIEDVAERVAKEGQQTKRDDLVARLLEAKLNEQPPHMSATNLVQQLIETDINGNAALAARVAIASGGAAYGKVVSVRNGFDSVVARKPKAISKGDQERLRALNLLSKPKKEGKAVKALKNILGG